MKTNPINTNYGTNFCAEIKPTKALKNGFNMIEQCTESGTMKDLNYVKDFLDSIAKISETEKVPEFKIEIDKRRTDYTYTKINGRRISGGHNERQPNIQDDYLVVEGIKKFASGIDSAAPSSLDVLKEQIESAQQTLDSLMSRYMHRIKVELEQAQKFIFDNVQ